jgi:hypothetical protein
MASGTVTPGGVVVGVAGGAPLDLGWGRESNGCGMALYAGGAGMLRMFELHLPRTRLVAPDRHPHRHRAVRDQLLTGVTLGAVAAGGPLVMTDLAAAGRLEGEITPP